jgi:hypothetical protein
VTTNPSNASVSAGSNATFNAAASGSPTPSVQWKVSTNGGTLFTAVSGATSSTLTLNSVTTSMNGYEYEATFTNSQGSATTTAATLSVSSASTLTQSTNWSGYAATSGPFSAVSGSWTVPTATCTQATTYSAVWIGIDGYSSNTVEQDGTGADCSGGIAVYSAWYEMYGDASVNNGYSVALSSTSYPVSPGDVMAATVSYANSQWTLTLNDTTANWNFSLTVASPSPPAAQSSAEWIVERPEVCSTSCSLTTLTTMSPVTFTNAKATSGTVAGSISQYAYSQMEMVSQNGTTVLALPSSLSADGLSFSVSEP